MHAIGRELQWLSRLFKAEVMVKVFFAQEPQSKDPRGAPFFWLRDQCRDALRWLTYMEVDPADAAIVHLHSDSGKDWSHVLGCYGSHPRSRDLADAVSGAVEEHMETGDRRLWDYSGYIFSAEAGPYPAALVELGSHESAHDVPRLLNAGGMAQAVLKGALAYLGAEIPADAPQLEPEIPDEVYWGYLVPGIPYSPDFAIPRNWRAARRLGNLGNFGPPTSFEYTVTMADGREVYRQDFANGTLEVDPANGWRASRLALRSA